MKNKNYFKKLSLALVMLVGFTNFVKAQVPSYVPTNGLVGYWPFSGNANDISGNANNGTNNGATLTTDRFGNVNSAYSFDGSTSKIKVPHNNSLNAYPITISTWIKSQSNMGGIVSKYVGCSDNGWSIHSNNNKISGYYYNFAGGSYVNFDPNTSAININDNSWHQVVETYDTLGGKIFIDGNLISTVSFSGTGTSSVCSTIADLYFGYRVPGNPVSCVNYNYFFQGIIDDIGIWNRALTSNEILGLYQAETSCQSLVINSGTLSSFNPPVYQSTVTIYPNPANDHITIDCGTLANVVGYHIEIVNTLGQVVFNQPMNTQQYNVALNTWSGTGVYFVKIYDASNNLMNTKKIILQ